MARVVIAGATGTIGRALTDALLRRGDEVVAMSRNPHAAHGVGAAQLFAWPEPTRAPPPAEALSGSDAVVSVMGEPIAQRWSDDAKRRIRDSRVLGTRSLVEGIRALPAQAPPPVFVSQSATRLYGAR